MNTAPDLALPIEPLPLEIQRHIDSCDSWLTLGRPDEAELELKAIGEQFGTHRDLLAAWLRVFLASKNRVGAELLAFTINHLYGSDIGARLSASCMLYERGDFAQCRDYLRDTGPYLKAYSSLDSSVNARHREEGKDFLRLLAFLLTRDAMCCYKLGQYDEARAGFSGALSHFDAVQYISEQPEILEMVKAVFDKKNSLPKPSTETPQHGQN